MIGELRSRQVHLDFHTGASMPNVAKQFDKKQFQHALKTGNVNSITVFAKCHHSFCYYPTDVGMIHPTMKQDHDLTGEMIEACHEIGVRAPVYITIGFSATDAQLHPEWIIRDKQGNPCGINISPDAKQTDRRPECSWWYLCYNGSYSDHLYSLTEEICKRYSELDGLFYDIVYLTDKCYCDSCVSMMKKNGVSLDDESAVMAFYQKRQHEVLDKLVDILKSYHPRATIFFNSGGAEISFPHRHYLNTHFEMEDLPTTWGGYDKMPIRAKFMSAMDKDYLGMTGKFHMSWGEFGGFKLPEALRFECASLMTWGARISVGDQLPPNGLMDMSTYENIGHAFRYVEEIEQYCFDVTETSKLGILIDHDETSHNGLAKLLLDSQLDFDILHSTSDLSRFETVIVAEGVRLDDAWAKAVDSYVKNGNKLLILGGGALKNNSDTFAIDLPFEYVGKSEYAVDYLQVGEEINDSMVKSPILCYYAADRIKGDAEVLASLREPYFDRTYSDYCSHANTPYRDSVSDYPAALRSENVIYLAHRIGSMYLDYGCSYHRRYFLNVLNVLYKKDDMCVITDLLSAARVRLVEQRGEGRYVLHLLLALATQRGKVSVLEDFPTLYNTPIEIKSDHKINSVKLQPSNIEIPFLQEGNSVKITVPEFSLHQVVTFEYR